MNEFLICIDNAGYEASLIVGKVYRRLADEEGERHGLVRIIDEDVDEQEGYLYPASLFVPIELPQAARKALVSAV